MSLLLFLLLLQTMKVLEIVRSCSGEGGDLGLCSQPVKYTARHSQSGGIVIIFV